MSKIITPIIDRESQDIYKLKSFITIRLSRYFEEGIFDKVEILSQNVEFLSVVLKAIAYEIYKSSMIRSYYSNQKGDITTLEKQINRSILKWIRMIFHGVKTTNNNNFIIEISDAINKIINNFFILNKSKFEETDKDAFRVISGRLIDLISSPSLDHAKMKEYKKRIENFKTPKQSRTFIDLIKTRITNWGILENKHHELSEIFFDSLTNIYFLLVSILANAYVIGKSDSYLPYLLTLEKDETVIIWPKLRIRKRIFYELSRLTTHREIIPEYYGKHFGIFSGYIFGLFAYCIKRDIHADDDHPFYDRYGLTVRYLKLVLFYLGMIDPSLWNILQNENLETRESPTMYKRQITPKKISSRELENIKDIDSLFNKWIKKEELYEEVKLRIKLFLETFISTIDFIPEGFENKSFVYSNVRSQMGKAFRRITKDLLYKNENERIYRHKKFLHKNVNLSEYEVMPLFLKYLYFNDKTKKIDIPITEKFWRLKEDWRFSELGSGESIQDISVTVPKNTKKILDEMIEGIHFYDIYKIATELNFFLESLYDYSVKHKRSTLGREKQEYMGAGFMPLSSIIEKRLLISEETLVKSKILNIIRLITQLNEVNNLTKMLEKFYNLNDTRKWYFIEQDKENNTFDILFDRLIISNPNIMFVVIMINNIEHNSNDPIRSKEVRALETIVEHLGIYNSIVNEPGNNVDDIKYKVDKFCLELMKDLYPLSKYRIRPEINTYSSYYIKQIMLKFFIRNVLQIMNLWDERKLKIKRISATVKKMAKEETRDFFPIIPMYNGIHTFQKKYYNKKYDLDNNKKYSKFFKHFNPYVFPLKDYGRFKNLSRTIRGRSFEYENYLDKYLRILGFQITRSHPNRHFLDDVPLHKFRDSQFISIGNCIGRKLIQYTEKGIKSLLTFDIENLREFVFQKLKEDWKILQTNSKYTNNNVDKNNKNQIKTKSGFANPDYEKMLYIKKHMRNDYLKNMRDLNLHGDYVTLIKLLEILKISIRQITFLDKPQDILIGPEDSLFTIPILHEFIAGFGYFYRSLTPIKLNSTMNANRGYVLKHNKFWEMNEILIGGNYNTFVDELKEGNIKKFIDNYNKLIKRYYRNIFLMPMDISGNLIGTTDAYINVWVLELNEIAKSYFYKSMNINHPSLVDKILIGYYDANQPTYQKFKFKNISIKDQNWDTDNIIKPLLTNPKYDHIGFHIINPYFKYTSNMANVKFEKIPINLTTQTTQQKSKYQKQTKKYQNNLNNYHNNLKNNLVGEFNIATRNVINKSVEGQMFLEKNRRFKQAISDERTLLFNFFTKYRKTILEDYIKKKEKEIPEQIENFFKIQYVDEKIRFESFNRLINSYMLGIKTAQDTYFKEYYEMINKIRFTNDPFIIKNVETVNKNFIKGMAIMVTIIKSHQKKYISNFKFNMAADYLFDFYLKRKIKNNIFPVIKILPGLDNVIKVVLEQKKVYFNFIRSPDKKFLKTLDPISNVEIKIIEIATNIYDIYEKELKKVKKVNYEESYVFWMKIMNIINVYLEQELQSFISDLQNHIRTLPQKTEVEERKDFDNTNIIDIYTKQYQEILSIFGQYINHLWVLFDRLQRIRVERIKTTTPNLAKILINIVTSKEQEIDDYINSRLNHLNFLYIKKFNKLKGAIKGKTFINQSSIINVDIKKLSEISNNESIEFGDYVRQLMDDIPPIRTFVYDTQTRISLYKQVEKEIFRIYEKNIKKLNKFSTNYQTLFIKLLQKDKSLKISDKVWVDNEMKKARTKIQQEIKIVTEVYYKNIKSAKSFWEFFIIKINFNGGIEKFKVQYNNTFNIMIKKNPRFSIYLIKRSTGLFDSLRKELQKFYQKHIYPQLTRIKGLIVHGYKEMHGFLIGLMISKGDLSNICYKLLKIKFDVYHEDMNGIGDLFDAILLKIFIVKEGKRLIRSFYNKIVFIINEIKKVMIDKKINKDKNEEDKVNVMINEIMYFLKLQIEKKLNLNIIKEINQIEKDIFINSINKEKINELEKKLIDEFKVYIKNVIANSEKKYFDIKFKRDIENLKMSQNTENDIDSLISDISNECLKRVKSFENFLDNNIRYVKNRGYVLSEIFTIYTEMHRQIFAIKKMDLYRSLNRTPQFSSFGNYNSSSRYKNNKNDNDKKIKKYYKNLYKKRKLEYLNKSIKTKSKYNNNKQIKKQQIKTGIEFRFKEDMNVISLFPKSELGYSSISGIFEKFPKNLEWRDAKNIQILSFGDRQTYLLGDLMSVSHLFLFSSDIMLTNPSLYSKSTLDNNILGIFKYNIPPSINVVNSLTLKLKQDKIFTSSQILKLRLNVNKLIIHSDEYIDLLSQEKVKHNILNLILKKFRTWGKLFFKKFLGGYELKESRNKSKIEDTYIKDFLLSNIKKIQNSIKSIWSVLFPIFKKININNKKQYYNFISFIFDTKRGQIKSPIFESSTIVNILSMRNLRSAVYKISNPTLRTYMNDFRRYHLIVQNFTNTLQKNPNFIISSAVILKSKSFGIYDHNDITNKENYIKYFDTYLNMLYKMNLLDIHDKPQLQIRDIIDDWSDKSSNMIDLLQNEGARESRLFDDLNPIEDVYYNINDEEGGLLDAMEKISF